MTATDPPENLDVPHESGASTGLPAEEALMNLWRASCASIKVYEHAVDAIDSDPYRFDVGDMLERHRSLSGWLGTRVQSRDLDAEGSSYLWGNVLVPLERLAAAMGDRACLTVLQAGEQHNLRQARAMLDDLTESELADWIRQQWLPALEQNTGELDSMLYALRSR